MIHVKRLLRTLATIHGSDDPNKAFEPTEETRRLHKLIDDQALDTLSANGFILEGVSDEEIDFMVGIVRGHWSARLDPSISMMIGTEELQASFLDFGDKLREFAYGGPGLSSVAGEAD